MNRFASLVFGLALASCQKAPSPAEHDPAREVPVAAGAPMNLAVPDEVRVKLDLAAARTAILTYQQSKGAFPASLDDLGLKLNYPLDMKYDAATGQISSITHPRF